jgi:TP901 family phage tail tape measure protein
MATHSTTLKFVLVADTSKFDARMQKAIHGLAAIGTTAETGTKKAVTGANRLSNAFSRAQSVITSVAVSLAFIGAMRVFGGVIKSAIEFDAAFTGVRKTVDGTPEQMEALRLEFRQLASEIPYTTEELSKIGMVAGQLGVAVEDIGQFTRVVADLAVAAEDLEVEDAARALARISKVMGEDISQAERLSSTIVHLGNKFATTEGEIVEMTLRMADAGRVIGLATPEAVALATALSQLGVKAQAGGTAWRKTFMSMKTAVDTGSSSLNLFAKVTGHAISVQGEHIKTGEQFAKVFRDKPIKAIAQFVSGMTRIIKEGGPAFKVLDSLGLANIRVARGVLSAAAAEGELIRAIKEGNIAWADGNKAREEAVKFYSSWEKRLEVVGNRLVLFAQAQSEAWMPGFVSFLESAVEPINDWRIALDQTNAALDRTGEKFGWIESLIRGWIILWQTLVLTVYSFRHGFLTILDEIALALQKLSIRGMGPVRDFLKERISIATQTLGEHLDMMKTYMDTSTKVGNVEEHLRRLFLKTGVSISTLRAELEKTDMATLTANLTNEDYVKSLQGVKTAVDEGGEGLGEFSKDIEKFKNQYADATKGNEAFVTAIHQLIDAGEPAIQVAKAFENKLKTLAETQEQTGVSMDPLIMMLAAMTNEFSDAEKAAKALAKEEKELAEAQKQNGKLMAEFNSKFLKENGELWLERRIAVLRNEDAELSYATAAAIARKELKLLDTGLEKNERTVAGVAKTYNTTTQALGSWMLTARDGVKQMFSFDQIMGDFGFDTKRGLALINAEWEAFNKNINQTTMMGREWGKSFLNYIGQVTDRTRDLTGEQIYQLTQLVRGTDVQLKREAFSVWEEYIEQVKHEYGTLPPKIAELNGEMAREMAQLEMAEVWDEQISTIRNDLAKMMADAIVDWEGMWSAFVNIMKSFAKSILRVFFEQLLNPLLKGFSSFLQGSGFKSGVQGAGGFLGLG